MEEIVLSRETVLQIAQKKDLSDIKALQLSEMQIKSLDNSAEVMNSLCNLVTLDLSGNEIQDIGKNLNLPKLRLLDVSDNMLEDLMFVQQFPNLEVLCTEGNFLEAADKYISVALCPKLKKINGNSVDTMNTFINNFKDRVRPEVEGVWQALFADQYTGGVPADEYSAVLEKLTAVSLKRMSLSTSMKKYKDFLVRKVSEEILESVKDASCIPTPKRKRVEKKFFDASPVEESTTPKRACRTPSKTSQAFTPRSSRKSVGGQDRSATVSSPVKYTSVKEKWTGKSLPAISDYEPAHFIRCHFGDTKTNADPEDSQTTVWKCAFEPSLTEQGQDTDIVATCGGNTVCLIDCKTGHIMKRYRQQGEVFYTLAWTTITLTSDGRSWNTNILIVAGGERHVKLIHPAQLVCYAEFSAVERAVKRLGYISCLLVHPQEPTYLFCGMSDGTIALWDIDTPSGPKYSVTPKLLMRFQCPGESILNMVYCVESDHLLGACEVGMYAWKINPSGRVYKSLRDEDFELLLPSSDGKWEDNMFVDGLVCLNNDLMATKAADTGSICIWSWSSIVSTKPKRGQVKVHPLYILDWCDIEDFYITLGFGSGVLICGDNVGQLYMYNIQPLLNKKSMTSDEILKPSRVLDWPMCDVDSGREQEKKMTDLQEKREKLIVNCATVSASGQYVVSGTDNNLVCIWRRES